MGFLLLIQLKMEIVKIINIHQTCKIVFRLIHFDRARNEWMIAEFAGILSLDMIGNKALGNEIRDVRVVHLLKMYWD